MNELLTRFHEIAANPEAQFEKYLQAGKQVVLCAPVYTPEEIISAMGLVPFGAWGADRPLSGAKQYFPSFICSIAQSIVELGLRGTYAGASAIVIPSLCDSLKVLGENWKAAVPSIPFVPMVYPQNRKLDAGAVFVTASYRRVIADLERVTGVKFIDDALAKSIEVYNRHNALMRRLSETLARHPEITARQRSDLFKSAFFMEKAEHTRMVEAFLLSLGKPGESVGRRIITSGILTDSPALCEILDKNGLHIVADDVAAESRRYAVDAPEADTPLDALSRKFCGMGNCSVLYDTEKKRAERLVQLSRSREADGVLVVLTKFCDPEEFDWPILKKACDAAGLPVTLVEVDRQMTGNQQAATAIQAFKEVLEARG